jgi:hypothetical protein
VSVLCDNARMTRGTAIFVLFCAALLEAGGDAIVRVALHTAGGWQRVLLFIASAGILFSYGWVVNAPAWDFGKLLGLYVTFFFVIAQLVSWLGFKQPPSTAVLLGGLLIVAGGVVIAASNQ